MLIEDSQQGQSECANLLDKGQQLRWQRHRKCEGEPHTYYIHLDLSDIHAPMLGEWVPPLTEVLHYSPSNAVMRSKYATEQCSICTWDCHSLQYMVVVSAYRCNVIPSPSSFPTIFTQIRQHMYIKRNTLSKRRILNFVRISLSKNECVKLTWNYAWVCQMMAYVTWLSAMMCHIFGFIMAKDTSTALQDLCQDLLTQALVVWAALLTQDNVHKRKS